MTFYPVANEVYSTNLNQEFVEFWHNDVLKPSEVSHRNVCFGQLLEWSLPTPEVHSSNTVGGKFYILYHLY